jgi:prepilin-type N-terminal cleavage/methylation domain-containing protein
MNRRKRRGFTLVEVLMVMLIIAITTGITIPYFVHSLRGNRLRSATRTVVMAGRYARSMALLKQQAIVIAFDLDQGQVRVEPRYAPATLTDTQGEAMAESTAADAATDTETTNANPQRASAGEQIALTRSLEEVRIDYVEVGDKGQRAEEGMVRVFYQTNGRCTPYKVRLVDERDNAVVITVDPLSTATTDRNDK